MEQRRPVDAVEDDARVRRRRAPDDDVAAAGGGAGDAGQILDDFERIVAGAGGAARLGLRDAGLDDAGALDARRAHRRLVGAAPHRRGHEVAHVAARARRHHFVDGDGLGVGRMQRQQVASGGRAGEAEAAVVVGDGAAPDVDERDLDAGERPLAAALEDDAGQVARRRLRARHAADETDDDEGARDHGTSNSSAVRPEPRWWSPRVSASSASPLAEATRLPFTSSSTRQSA